MAKLSENELKRQIKAGEFKNAYFIYGEEDFLKEHYVSLIKSKAVAPAFESFNLHEYDGKDVELDDVLKDTAMLPVMSEYNLVLLRDYPIERSKKDLKLIKEILEDIPETTIFIFALIGKELDKKSPTLKSLVSYFDKYGAVINFERQSEDAVVKHLLSGAKKRGAVLSAENARYLIYVSGNDLKTLSNEIDKLAYYVNGGEITADVIDNMAVKSLQAVVYDLSKAVVAGDFDKAYSVLSTLINNKEDPIKLNYVIAGAYIDMYRVKCARSVGKSYDDLTNYFNYKGREFTLKNAVRNGERLTKKQLRASLDAITESEVRLKSTSADKKIVLEELVAKLVLIARENKYA